MLDLFWLGNYFKKSRQVLRKFLKNIRKKRTKNLKSQQNIFLMFLQKIISLTKYFIKIPQNVFFFKLKKNNNYDIQNKYFFEKGQDPTKILVILKKAWNSQKKK